VSIYVYTNVFVHNVHSVRMYICMCMCINMCRKHIQKQQCCENTNLSIVLLSKLLLSTDPLLLDHDIQKCIIRMWLSPLDKKMYGKAVLHGWLQL